MSLLRYRLRGCRTGRRIVCVPIGFGEDRRLALAVRCAPICGLYRWRTVAAVRRRIGGGLPCSRMRIGDRDEWDANPTGWDRLDLCLAKSQCTLPIDAG